jgi:hypothetical protein
MREIHRPLIGESAWWERRSKHGLPGRTAAMLIRVSDPAAVPALVAALNERAHYVVKPQGEDEIAVSVLGSFADGGQLELTLFLVAWQSAHPTVTAELVEH